MPPLENARHERFARVKAGYVDQAIDVEEMGGGMIVIDPLLDDWFADDWEDGDDMGLAA